MPLIKTVSHEEAEGQIKQVYDMMAAMAGSVPKPLQLLSVSPKIFDVNMQALQYYFQHPNLSANLLAAIRFVSATHCEYPYCIDMNKKILTNMAGMSEDQVAQLLKDPEGLDMPEKDRAMLTFVKNALKAPEDVQQEDVDKLRDLGWLDSDIFEAVNHGAFMVAGGILFNTFKMGI